MFHKLRIVFFIILLCVFSYQLGLVLGKRSFGLETSARELLKTDSLAYHKKEIWLQGIFVSFLDNEILIKDNQNNQMNLLLTDNIKFLQQNQAFNYNNSASTITKNSLILGDNIILKAELDQQNTIKNISEIIKIVL